MNFNLRGQSVLVTTQHKFFWLASFSTNEFYFWAEDVGCPSAVELWRDNSGWHSDWHAEQVRSCLLAIIYSPRIIAVYNSLIGAL